MATLKKKTATGFQRLSGGAVPLPPEATPEEIQLGSGTAIKSWSIEGIWLAITAKLGSILTTHGDLLFRNATAVTRLPKGAAGTILTMGADEPAWVASGGGTTLLETVSPSVDIVSWQSTANLNLAADEMLVLNIEGTLPDFNVYWGVNGRSCNYFRYGYFKGQYQEGAHNDWISAGVEAVVINKANFGFNGNFRLRAEIWRSPTTGYIHFRAYMTGHSGSVWGIYWHLAGYFPFNEQLSFLKIMGGGGSTALTSGSHVSIHKTKRW
jgi:hypothetical protein